MTEGRLGSTGIAFPFSSDECNDLFPRFLAQRGGETKIYAKLRLPLKHRSFSLFLVASPRKHRLIIPSSRSWESHAWCNAHLVRRSNWASGSPLSVRRRKGPLQVGGTQSPFHPPQGKARERWQVSTVTNRNQTPSAYP